MAQIINIDGLTMNDINSEIKYGAKFVVFQYCISIFILTFKRSSDIYFIKSGCSTLKHSIGYTLISLVFGWWGIPWGPIYTIGSVFTNLMGGKDITQEVMSSIN